MRLSILLPRLDKVSDTGHSRYVARRPAHDDRSPSLAIKDCSDGRVSVNFSARCIEVTFANTENKSGENGVVRQELVDAYVRRLNRIETILRNGLPTSDKGNSAIIAHAHSEIESLLESIDEDWWMN